MVLILVKKYKYFKIKRTMIVIRPILVPVVSLWLIPKNARASMRVAGKRMQNFVFKVMARFVAKLSR